MKIKRYHISVIMTGYIIIFFLVTGIAVGIPAHAQPESNAQQEFEKLNKEYHAHQLTADQYLAKADSLVHQLLSEGKRFQTGELVDLLSQYEEIAWSAQHYGRDRINYFYLFFNNARMGKQKGVSIYYAEKIAEAYKDIGEEHPLIAQLQLTKIYQELRLYDQVIAVFESERNYLESLPELLREGRIDNSVALNALYILSPVVTGYTKSNDTASVRSTASLANQIGTILQQDDSLSRPQQLYNDILMIDIARSVANFEGRYDDASQLLNRMEQLKTTYKDQATNFIDINLVRFRIENHKRLGNTDSLRYYIEKYASSPNFGNSQSADISESKAELATLQGDYRSAYNYLIEALQHERDLQASLMAESSDLLYAFTQAEHNAIALQRAEQVKRKRTLWLVVVSSIAALSVLAIYLTMVRRSRKAKVQVDALNDAANMQVIAMEEEKQQAIKEEKQRLGQDLHDGLSASIAAIRHQLEILAMDAGDTALAGKLTDLQSELAHAYEVARNKSHDWFSATDGKEEQSFAHRISTLANTALPDSRYSKTIHIDSGALARVDVNTRITLLRIIQEAITNIIKHAKATRVDILVYEEMDRLVLTVKDNGRGLTDHPRSRRKSAIGLESIQRRVNILNGELDIQSGDQGTEVILAVPLLE